MKQKVWILLAVVVLLIALTQVRERFEATPSIKAPPYDEAERARIRNMVSKADLDIILADMTKNVGSEASAERIKDMAQNTPAQMVGDFFQTTYSRAQTPITDAEIDTYMKRWSHFSTDMKEAIKRVLRSYFVNQDSKKTGYAEKLVEMGQEPGYSSAPPEGAMGMTTAAASTVPGLSTTTGSSTGGSSTSSMGPTSGNSGSRDKQVFGPVFTARGDGNPGGNGGDSTQNNTYPELMGGRSGTPSTKVAGAGVVPPSKNWLLSVDGSLPSWDSLGSADMSKYFPTARTPGDMDLIPDPYRLSRNFSTSSYSSKTEPAPFLTDFSAFLK
jgi:hypothetical protein